MRRIAATLAVVGALLFGAGSACADFDDGVAALNSGDYATAFRELLPYAKQGNAGAQYTLGVMYENGDGVPRDDVEAVKWYRKAAEQEFAEAQHNLGVAYRDGLGVPKNDAEAVKWYRKAAEQGLVQAQFSLGSMYANGRGVPKNDAETVKWISKAAEQGHVTAQYNFGFMYANGKGVPEDYVKAHMWWSLAKAQGYKYSAKWLDIIKPHMTPAQIIKAQDLADEWREKHN